jgi:O-antigen ligase
LGAAVPFAITLLITAFAPLIEGGTTHTPVFVLRVMVLALLVSCAAPGLKERRLVFYRTPLDLAVAALLAVALVSTFIAPYRYMALTWVQLIFYYALFFYLARRTVTPDRAGAVVLTVLSLGAFEASVAVFQWYSGTGRANGTFFNPNMLADYLLPPLLISVSLMIFRHRWARGAKAAGLVFVIVLCSAVVVLTGSRGGALAAIAGLFVVFWIRKRTLAVAALVVLAAAVLLVPNPVRDRFHSGEPFAY